VADGSLFTTAGGYNPTHIIEALAHWVASYIAANREAVLEGPRSLVAASVATGRPSGCRIRRAVRGRGCRPRLELRGPLPSLRAGGLAASERRRTI
jgi:hypothetical protein